MNDELMHPVGDDPAWSESYYFNFVDPTSKLAIFTRMGFRPGSGWADALHVVYLPGKRVAFTYGRREIGQDLAAYNDDLHAGDLTLTCLAPHKLWRLQYEGSAQDIADAEILLERRKQRPADWFVPATLQMDLEFDCLTEPHYAAQGEHGHFEQSGRMSGLISLDGQSWQVQGFGVRDKSWGPRDWGGSSRVTEPADAPRETVDEKLPTPFVNWFSMNFGADAALGGSCFRHADGQMRGSGWLQKGGETLDLEEVVIVSRYQPDSILHTSLTLEAKTSAGERIVISGKVLNVCPTKIAMPGGATFVNEGLTEFTWDGKTGYGIAEHWHAVDIK